MMSLVSDVNARAVDPRDIEWEVWDAAYRVYFWRALGPEGAWSSREVEVSGGDAAEVITWAAHNAIDDETYTVFALVDRHGEQGLVHLTGVDPSRPERSWL